MLLLYGVERDFGYKKMDSLEKPFSTDDNCESLIRAQENGCEHTNCHLKMIIDRISFVILLVISLVAALTHGAPIESDDFNSEVNTPIPILSQTEINSPDGSFSYRYFE